MYCEVLKNGGILLANSNHLYFNKLVKTPCHKTPYRRPHRLSLSSQSSRSCAGLKIKVLKDKALEFANTIPPSREQTVYKEKTSGRISLQPCQEGASEADLKLFSLCFQSVVL